MSHTPSRPGTPGSRVSPSRLPIRPSIRPTPSLSSLNIHSHTIEPIDIPPALPLPTHISTQTLESSASSIITVDTTEGILFQDVDAETEDGGDIIVTNRDVDLETRSGQMLRDQLRKTLGRKNSKPDITTKSAPSATRDRSPEINNVTFDAANRFAPREYYVLTDAGKPVFISRPTGETPDDVTTTIGIMQALVSVYLDDNDKLRCINAGKTRISFILRPPLYYASVSSWGEPESVTRSHLEYLHLQILSIVTAAQLKRIFERRTNFDLRRLLDGAESFLDSLLHRLEFDLAMSTSSLHCLKLDPGLRKRAAEALVPSAKIKDILYVFLVARSRVITLIRPRKHSIHPADIHILLNTIHAPSIINSPASSSWIPVCLPKFNPSGFVNAYISFVRKDDGHSEGNQMPTLNKIDDNASHISATPTQGFTTPAYAAYDQLGLVLVCISGNGEFDVIREWCDGITQRLDKEGVFDAIATAVNSNETEYCVADLGIPGLRHFVYKSRSLVQITAPIFEDPYNEIEDRRRLITLYQTLHDAIYAKSGQEGALKLQYIKTERESVMGWITQPFELYIALSPLLPKSAVVGAANAVARWVKKEEARLFLRDAPVF